MVSTQEFKGFSAGGYLPYRKSVNLGIVLYFFLVTSVLGVTDIQGHMVPKMHNSMYLHHVEPSWYRRAPPPSEVGVETAVGREEGV